MARTIYVKSARARVDKNTGEALPLRTCENCNKEIAVGSSYKHISIKTGPRSSMRRYRCDDCADWQVWEYSSSLSALIAEIDFNARNAIASADDQAEATDVLAETAGAIRELADQKRDSAQAIEDGFGHSTQQSEELASQADDLDAWADDLETATMPDDPDPEEAECETCEGAGQITEEGAQPVTQPCPDCAGKGHPEEATEEQLDAWRAEVTDVLDGALDSCPV